MMPEKVDRPAWEGVIDWPVRVAAVDDPLGRRLPAVDGEPGRAAADG